MGGKMRLERRKDACVEDRMWREVVGGRMSV